VPVPAEPEEFAPDCCIAFRDGTDNVATREKNKAVKITPLRCAVGRLFGRLRVGMGDWRREVISYKMLFYRET
jgi:hypothetical protein